MYVNREGSLERRSGRNDQTVRHWTARDNNCEERSGDLEAERNYQERASDRFSRDFKPPTQSRRSERHRSQPRHRDRRERQSELRNRRDSSVEHDWRHLNVERDYIQKNHHNQSDRERNFSEEGRYPSREERPSGSGNYFPQETKHSRESQVSWGRPEDQFLRPSYPRSYQAEKSPVRRFSSFERSHTATREDTYRSPNVVSKEAQNMYPGKPSASRGFSSQGDLDKHLAKEIVKRTCSSGGTLTLDREQWEHFCKQVIGTVPSGDMDAFFHLFPHIFSCETNPMFRPQRILRVKTNLELCNDHCNKDGCKRLVCEGLHCCKFFLLGTCKFKQNCRFGHNLADAHNQHLLAKHFLDRLTPPEIGVLLKSGKASQVLPKVCKFYNVDQGCRLGEKGEKCSAMHVCRHYILDDCSFKKNCKRSHNIYDAQPKNILKRHGIAIDRSPKLVLEELRAAMKKDECDDEDYSDGEIHSSDSDDCLGAVGPSPARPRQRTTSCDSTSSGASDSLEICAFFLRAKCSYGKACVNKHPQYVLPYLWQFEVGREWHDLGRPSNDEVELNYCEPDKSECFTNNLPTGMMMMVIDFEVMKYRLTNGESGNVRRLSTKSNQGRANNFLYLTQWHWFWKNSGGRWEEFGEHDDKSLTSDELEEEFSSNPNSHLSYVDDNGLEFVVDLQSMKKKDRRTGNVTDIRRRPDLFDPKTMKPTCKTERVNPSSPSHSQTDRKKGNSQPSSPAVALSQLNIGTIYPKTWNLEFTSDNDFFQIVPVQRGQPEFETIQKLFSATVPNIPLRSVRRIQNAELWDAFYRKKTWMEKKLKPGGKLNVMSLFHGTKELYLDAICQQGFDWRISGSSVGTKFGKGSYFARDAIYSSQYTDSRKLFVVQVLVGEFAQGDPKMVRPPPKDARQPLGEAYDSVVNSPYDPKIFVIFAQEQSYPEYLIEY